MIIINNQLASEPKSESELDARQAEFRTGLKKIDIEMVLTSFAVKPSHAFKKSCLSSAVYFKVKSLNIHVNLYLQIVHF